ncbi:MAG: primosomal protein N' [Bifidobacterium sp.]|jgi:primosomal protein N' (replication factor Y)
MVSQDAQQPTFDGLAPRRRRKRAPARNPAPNLPIASVVIDVQAAHLGQTFDYLVQERQDQAALPGMFVRVRFGGRLVNGVIWSRSESSPTPMSSLRYLERVIGEHVLVPASLRRDITAIADAFGGTRANIIRLAVPPRVARIEQEQGFLGAAGTPRVLGSEAERGFRHMQASYSHALEIHDALQNNRFQSFVIDALPGVGEWGAVAAWVVASAVEAGKSAVVVLPGAREIADMLHALQRVGLSAFSPATAIRPSDGSGPVRMRYDGDVAVLNASMSPAERYRAYLAISTGRVRCVVGTRAAMYAPVDGNAVFMIVDDAAYQNADGMMPYANARGVLKIRAQSHAGVFVALANARSVASQWEVRDSPVEQTAVLGASTDVHAFPAVTRERSPWIRWLNREELARLADSTAGARVPHTAVRILSRALQSGPVLLSIAQDGVGEALSCAHCHTQARCPRCTGPLQRVGGQDVRCRWCGAAVVNWQCPHCRGQRLRVVRVGAAGTARELQGLFRNVPMVLSSPSQPRGIVESIEDVPSIVISTPGAEPRIRARDGRDAAGYRAVAVLDAWTSLYAPGIDARVDALNAWMRAVSLCTPRTQGGQALLIGETDPAIARSLIAWDSTVLAAKELEDRMQTSLPPVVVAACVWGRRECVMGALSSMGALDGDYATLHTQAGDVPAVLGPVPIAAPRTVDAVELASMRDRVKAIIRVPQSQRRDLARRLHEQSARHVASRQTGELRFQIDPKDLI